MKNKALDVRYGYFFSTGFFLTERNKHEVCGVMEGPKGLEHTSFLGGEYSNVDPGKFHTFDPKFHCFGFAICLFGLDFLPGKDNFLTSKL